MRLRQLADVGPYDALYLSPHVDDAPLACAARLMSARARGARVLVCVACGDPAEPVPGSGWPATLERWNVDLVALGLPVAAERDPGYRGLRQLAFERLPCDDAAGDGLRQALLELRQRTRARDVYVPLGVGGHADHRLVQDAALGVFTPGDARNVFLYEERPAALLPNAVFLRLGQLGARLPPGTPTLLESGLARLLLRFQHDAHLGCDASEWAERVRCAPLLARQWRAARAWRPQRSLGPRLQPLLHAAGEPLPEAVSDAWQAWAARRATASLPIERARVLAGEYARRLGGAHVERYWLLLSAHDEAERGGRLEELTDRALAS